VRLVDALAVACSALRLVKDMPMQRKQAALAREVQRPLMQPEHVRRGPEIER
jgi:hypothetical protein